MKKNILCLFLVICTCVSVKGQLKENHFSMKNDLIVYERIYNFDQTNQKTLFKLSKGWIVHNFKDANEVVKSENLDLGEIIGKGISIFKDKPKKWYLDAPNISVEYSFMINIKEDKIRLRFYDFNRIYADYDEPDGIERIKLEEFDRNKRNAKKHGKNSVEAWNNTVDYFNIRMEEIFKEFGKYIESSLNDDF